MKITKDDALCSLKPGASWTIRGDTLIWSDTKQTQPTDSEINSEITRLQAIEDYQEPRRYSYASVSEQLDQLYWDKKNGTNKWVEAIDKVKSDNPKP